MPEHQQLQDHHTPIAGFLFIGDPHVWSRKPGRRTDPDFLSTVLGKIGQAATIANERNLLAVFLGDLLHMDDDEDTRMLIGLTRTLQQFNHVPVTLVGNHDKDELNLSERNPLLLLGVTGQIELMDRNAPFRRFALDTQNGPQTAVLGGTPYGFPIPHSLAPFTGIDLPEDTHPREEHRQIHQTMDADWIVWISHHDLAFANAHPHAEILHEILGADIHVNGHMHGTEIPVNTGLTTHYNPGNITRMSVDMDQHRPAVWAWTPESQARDIHGNAIPRLECIELEHRPFWDVFDHEGRHSAAPGKTTKTHTQNPVKSEFAQSLLGRRGQQTDDGSGLAETIAMVLQQHPVEEPIRTRIAELADRAIRDLEKA